MRRMPFKSAEAFVLRTHAVGDADQIMVFITEGEGKLRGIARSSRRSRKRFGGTLEPLSHVRVSYFEREGKDLVRIDQCDLLHSFFKIQQDLRVAGYLSYIAELSDIFCHEKQEEAHFYRLLRATLLAVESGVDPAWAARYFELWTLRLHGLLPDLASCARCARGLGSDSLYSALEHGLLCGTCAAGESGAKVSQRVLAHLRLLLREPPGAAGGEVALLGACEEFLQMLLTQFTERAFRSLRVLRDMGVR
jgi:DNA repair protein RecO (recombination protein O)